MTLRLGRDINFRYHIAKLPGQDGLGTRVRGVQLRCGNLTSVLILLMLALLGAFLVSCGTGSALTPAPIQVTLTEEMVPAPTTVRPQPTNTEISIPPSPTNTAPPPTDTATPTIAPTELPQIDMVLVEAGEFLMGSTEADKDGESDEMPQHKVYLDAYFIDRTEVTNARYRACVEAGSCTPPGQTKSATRAEYYGNPEFDDYPVIYVNWIQAVAYCNWRGARLPTEAEWEKAARGTDGRIYPWGEVEAIDCKLANFGGTSGCVGDTAKVGSYPDGASPYGVLDLSGNVWEWVHDWYLDVFYQKSPLKNPKGPSSGERHIVRGGSWSYGVELMRGASRLYLVPSTQNNYVGLRCVRSQ